MIRHIFSHLKSKYYIQESLIRPYLFWRRSMYKSIKWMITIIVIASLVFTAFQSVKAAPGLTTRISVSSSMAQANERSMNPSISADGRFIVFDSYADNLVANDTNGRGDVFLRDLNTNQTKRISIATNGTEGDEHSFRPTTSNNGNAIAFVSLATNLVTGDTNMKRDIFVHYCSTRQTIRVSLGIDGEQANDISDHPIISGDGRFLAFVSSASNLVDGDTNNAQDIFVHDLQNRITTRVSVNSLGAQANGASWRVAISENGRYMAFSSDANNLVNGDTNGASDIFRHDRITGETIRVSLNSNGSEANMDSLYPAISGDGRIIAFASVANLVKGDTNDQIDIFVRDVLASQTTRVSISSNKNESNNNSFFPKISITGRFVSFESYASNLVDRDTNNVLDIFTHDLVTGVTSRVSINSQGVEANGQSSYGHAISGDGRFVTFGSEANNLVKDDTNYHPDIFLYDQNYQEGFADVSQPYWAYDWINRLYSAGVTTGCGTNPLRYCPEQSVTRAEMAKFLIKGVHGGAYDAPTVGTSTGFNDVSTSHWAATWIKQLALEGITSGCGGGNYCPNSQVTRAQMAKFLLSAKYDAGYTPPGVGSGTGFNDVPTSYWAAAWIKQLAAEGITSGCGGGNYCPDAPVTRAEMAKFLVLTFELP